MKMITKFFATRITDILKEIDFANLTTQDQFKLLLVFYKEESTLPDVENDDDLPF